MGKKKKRLLIAGIGVAVCAIVLVAGLIYFFPGLGMSKAEKRAADLAEAEMLGEAIKEQVLMDHDNAEWDYFAGIEDGVAYRGLGDYSFDLQDIEGGNTLAEFYGSVPRVKMGYQYHFQVDSLVGYIRVYITDGKNRFLVYPRLAKWATESNVESPWYWDNDRLTWEEYEEYRKDE